WVLLNLNKGNLNGKQLISEAQIREMTTPQTLMPVATREPYNALVRAFGLGFQLQDFAGKLEVSHTCGLEGIVTQIVRYPQMCMGIYVLPKPLQGAAFMLVTCTLYDYLMTVAELT